MRISDWSSDVCSSDLLEILGLVDRFAVGLHDAIGGAQHQLAHADALEVEVVADHLDRWRHHVGELHLADAQSAAAAGRAEPDEKEADELPEGVETEAARHYRLSAPQAAEDTEDRLDGNL